MKKAGLVLIFLTVYASNLSAQTTEDSVKAVINRLFDAMRNADPEELQSVFADSAVLQTIRRTPEGGFYVSNENVHAFVKSVSNLKKDSADERIVFESIKIDGPMASVWTPYQFYYAGRFSHCGVNSFQVIRIRGTWKIQYLIDTRRRQDCK